MRHPRIKVVVLALLISASAAGGGWAVVSGAIGEGSKQDWVPVPHPPKGLGDHCVADTEFMRRNHMKMLFHQRKDTVHLGLRGEPFSLAGCVNCHAVRGNDGKPVAYSDPRHFCRSCHDYAAVSIDCFECHASRPATPGKAAQANPHSIAPDEDRAVLADYLRTRKP